MALRDWLAPESQHPATAKVAILAIAKREQPPPIARIAEIALASPQPPQAAETVVACKKPFDREAFDERTGIIEANGIPREWADGFATLCTMPCPATYRPERWQQIVDDGGYFLDQWGRKAAALGWRAVDVFGVDPFAPEIRLDGMGLVPLLNGHRICAITADTARIDCGKNSHLTFYRQHMADGGVAAWNLEGQ